VLLDLALPRLALASDFEWNLRQRVTHYNRVA
jgi:hypothetical protein